MEITSCKSDKGIEFTAKISERRLTADFYDGNHSAGHDKRGRKVLPVLFNLQGKVSGC